MQKIIAMLAVTGCLTGCHPSSPPVNSGLGTGIQSREFLIKAGAPLEVTGVSGPSSLSGIMNQGQFTLTLKSGTAGQYVASLRDAIKREIETRGGHTTGSSTVGTPTTGKSPGTAPEPSSSSLQSFTFNYTLNRNLGLVAVYSVPTATNQFQLILLTYEHLK